jgi:hypothetical protein
MFRSFVLTLLFTVSAVGQAPGNRTYMGEDIFVASGQRCITPRVLLFGAGWGDLTGHVFVPFEA